jgi:3-hydroxybutyryl-CoA dehydrogenase
MKVSNVGVVGCGLMGSGIAEVCAKIGCDVRVMEPNLDLLGAGMARIEASLARAAERGKITDEKKREIRGRIRGTTDLADFKDRDLVIEAVVEKMDAKKEVFRTLDRTVRAEAILATNTSSLSVTELAAATKRPGKVVGMHFFNPVPVVPLVEIVRAESTFEPTVATIRELGERMGKKIIVSPDVPGFIVNRLLVPYLLEAVRLVESGVASPEDVDAGMTTGCGHPMGPIRLLDYVGLDTTLFIAEYMFDQFKSPHLAPPPLLRRMVAAGRLGRKSGRGFYEWAKA